MQQRLFSAKLSLHFRLNMKQLEAVPFFKDLRPNFPQVGFPPGFNDSVFLEIPGIGFHPINDNLFSFFECFF
jgi:hypothetical protein